LRGATRVAIVEKEGLSEDRSMADPESSVPAGGEIKTERLTEAMMGAVAENYLLAFLDLTRFRQLGRRLGDEALFKVLSDLHLMVGDLVEEGEGRVVKTMGDGFLVVFPEELADRGVHTLRRVRSLVGDWLGEKGFGECELRVRIHFGTVIRGELGPRSDRRWDIGGEEVAVCAMLPCQGITLTPEAWGQLEPGTRTLFKRYAPPARYIGAQEGRPD
jgi:class 3 adenylate cyclase